MKLGIVTNVMSPTDEGATTYRIAAEAARRGHEVWITSTGNFALDSDDHVRALARSIPCQRFASPTEFLETFLGNNVTNRWISIESLDVLFLRNNPAAQTPWAQTVGVEFGRLAKRQGVIVVNDPDGLGRASSKLYFQTFPESVRPRTIITRNADRIEEFVTQEEVAVLKPLRGSGGQGVFMLRSQDQVNIREIIRSVSRDGYVVVQEYLPLAAEGDTRLFLINGGPLTHHGKVAAFRRVRTGDDLRSNIHAGGRIRRAHVDDAMLAIVEQVRPQLVADGMFMVGLDIVGDKLMEINVFTPGGLGSAQRFEKVDFSEAVVDALEQRAEGPQEPI